MAIIKVKLHHLVMISADGFLSTQYTAYGDADQLKLFGGLPPETVIAVGYPGAARSDIEIRLGELREYLLQREWEQNTGEEGERPKQAWEEV